MEASETDDRGARHGRGLHDKVEAGRGLPREEQLRAGPAAALVRRALHARPLATAPRRRPHPRGRSGARRRADHACRGAERPAGPVGGARPPRSRGAGLRRGKSRPSYFSLYIGADIKRLSCTNP